MYDLLGREVELREKRQTVLARTLEIQEVVLLKNVVLLMKMPMVMMMMVMPMAMAMVLLMVIMTTKCRWRPDFATLPNM